MLPTLRAEMRFLRIRLFRDESVVRIAASKYTGTKLDEVEWAGKVCQGRCQFNEIDMA